MQSKTMLITIMIPVLFSILFTAALKDVRLPRLAVVAKEKSQLLDALSRSQLFTLSYFDGEPEAADFVRSGKAPVAIILPDNIDAVLIDGSGTGSLSCLVDPSAPRQVAVITAGIREVLRVASGQNLRAKLEEKKVFEGKGGRGQEFLPTWILLSLMGALMIVASSLVEEKEKKTLQAVLVTPISLEHIVLGKGILGIIITLGSCLIVLALNGGLAGNLLSLAILLVLGAVSFSLLGIVIGQLAPSQSAANSINAVLYILFFLPIVLSESSRTMDILARGLPSYYVVDGITKAIMICAPVERVGVNIAYLLAFSAGLFTMSRKLLAHQNI
ncbi:MAG: ABC transporter permease [Armatimonadetes bacterium]|nr:ABC transporter permease [Armatimonadota bacterium]